MYVIWLTKRGCLTWKLLLSIGLCTCRNRNCDYTRTELADTFLDDIHVWRWWLKVPLSWFLICQCSGCYCGRGGGLGNLLFFPRLCVVFLFVLLYWFHLMKFGQFKLACTLLTGRYVGSRPIKLRKSTWKQRNIDTVRKKEKEKTALIGLLTGRWPKLDCGELLILLTLLFIHYVAVFKAGVQK